MIMKKIIAPIDRKKLIKKLTRDKFAGITNKGSKEIYPGKSIGGSLK
jgi:hypothetical protein